MGTRDIAGVTVSGLVRLMANRDVSDHYPRRTHTRGAELLRVDALGGGPLRDVSFVLHRGEMLGIAGLVGAGRTRLARAIGAPIGWRAGGSRSTAGGADHLAGATPSGRGIGFLPEDRKQQGLVLGLTVERNVSLSHLARPGPLRRCRPRQGARRGGGSDGDAAHPYPGTRTESVASERRQSAEGRARQVARPRPRSSSSMSRRAASTWGAREIYQLMNHLAEQGAGVILMISSDLPEVLGMSDRMLVMRGGAVRSEFAAAEATEERMLQAALGVSA